MYIHNVTKLKKTHAGLKEQSWPGLDIMREKYHHQTLTLTLRVAITQTRTLTALLNVFRPNAQKCAITF